MHNHNTCGWSCACWYVLGIVIWIAAAISLVYGWVAIVRGSLLGQQTSFWFANAMVLGVLAIPLRLKGGECGCGDCGGNGVCKPKK